VRSSCGIEPAELRAWADRLRAARYAAVFYGTDPGPASHIAALFLLVRDLNAVTRCVAVPLGEPGNRPGAEAVLAWQTGYPAAVDFAAGFPRFRPGTATAEARLATGAADAALIVGAEPAGLPAAAREHLDRIPRVVIAPDAALPSRAATVGLTSARTGLEAAGTVARADGLMLPLRPPLDPPCPTDRDWLLDLC
jgi:formylmethanofuran dehydrogenase subunit B